MGLWINYPFAYINYSCYPHFNMETSDEFVIIRVKESTRSRLKVKASRNNKFIWEVAEEMSKNECIWK